jgi:predicted metal-dependent HD superfamily phosphohydrolase
MNPLIKSVEKYVPVFLKKNLDSNFVFHNLNHTYEVVQAALEIGQGSDLATSEMDILIVAAWFHDCGYVNAYIGHEEESKKIAKSYLEKWGANTDFILSVLACIEATKYPQHPGTMVEKVLCDADFFHFTKPSYPQYAKTIRKEFEVFLDKIYSDEEWLKVNTSLLMAHNYCTEYGKSVLRRFKNVNIELVNKKKN